MASDGDLNVGMSSESDLHDYVDEQRETGIYLSVLGFGSGNYKDNKMETLADHGNGSYHYIDCIEEAERVLGTRLTANLVPLADDVKLQVEFNPAQVKGYRLIGYENRAMADEDFRDDEKDAGDVGPGAQFTVAYEVALTDSKQEIATSDLKYDNGSTGDATSDEWLTATIRYQPADGGDTNEQVVAVGKRDLAKDPGEDWRFQAAVIELGMLLRDSDYAGTASLDQIEDLVGTGKLNAEREGFLELADLALGEIIE
jgi:Ca-activated chloride channel family protein